jgi:hypothetical protein
MTIRHTGKHRIVMTPTYRAHRRVTWILSAIVVSLALIVVAMADLAYTTQTGASLTGGLFF